MAIHDPPQNRYSLFEKWDKDAFALIKRLAKIGKYPKITGSPADINQFLTTLIRTQKSLHDWRDFPRDILAQIRDFNRIDTVDLNRKYPPEIIAKDMPEWATYEGDKIVSNFIDDLEVKQVQFMGKGQEITEFILRFILGQLGHDWEQTIFMIYEMLGNGKQLQVSELNREMEDFDYCKLFA